jgi:HAD superfamily hydrolase (TIGR01509 family)
MSIRALIFDLDGTILDTEILWQKAAAHILTVRGISPTDGFMQSVLGATAKQSCEISKKTYTLPETLETLMNEMFDQFLELYKQQPKFINGFQEFFKDVLVHNLPHAVATNTTQDILAQITTNPSLQSLFGSHIYTPEAVANKGKPHPDIYLHTASQLGVLPEECLVIEDSVPGITAAKRAGMMCIRIDTHRTPGVLAGEDFVVESYAQIPLERLLSLDQAD